MESPPTPDAAESAALDTARVAVERLEKVKADPNLIAKARDELQRLQAARDERLRLETPKSTSDAKDKATRDAKAKADQEAAYQDFLDAQAAASVAALHAQAVAVSNVQAMIPIVLDLSSTNYSKWKALFLNTPRKYELSDHMLSNVDAATASSAYWTRMDCAVKSWLFGTITPALMEVIHSGHPVRSPDVVEY